jgi:predicted TIM-barrel fold metal-dependent hydrolase
MDRVLIVSADGHCGGPPEIYRDYLEQRYHDDLDGLAAEHELWVEGASSNRFSPEELDVIDEREAIRSGGELGAWEFDRRLAELDREGVAGDLLIPGHQLSMPPFFGVMNRPYPAELRAAGARAYHRQLADAMAAGEGRLYGVADPGPCLDMDETVRELRWVADHGFVSVTPPGSVADPKLPPFYDSYYDPFWAACAELGLTLTAHSGYGLPQSGKDIATAGLLMKQAAAAREAAAEQVAAASDPTQGDRPRVERMSPDVRFDQMPANSFTRLAYALPRRLLLQLMLGGVFDRYPTFKLVLTNARADWVPATIDYLDRRFDEGALPLRAMPSEYWRRHCAVAPASLRPSEVALREEIGVDQLLFAMDFPHPEGTWPNTRDWLRTTFTGVPEKDARLILGENALAFYRLDREKLTEVAQRIGPTPDDVLGGHPVDPRVVQHFHDRSGFAQPPEHLDREFLDGYISEDTRGLATSNA